MNPDKFQEAWQADSTQTRITIDVSLLANEVRRSQRNFRATIFWRDFREVGIALLLLPYWFYQGITKSLPWTWYLTVPALIWIAGFFLVDRIRHPKRPSHPGEPLLDSVQESLTQVEHQIWLLRNIFWWYLLPPSISIMAFFVHVSLLSSGVWWKFLAAVALLGSFLFVIYGFIYFLNQRAVRVTLEPRRQELLTLLGGLGVESIGERAAKNSARTLKSTIQLRRLCLAVASCLLIPVAISFVGELFHSEYDPPSQSSGSVGGSLASLVTDVRKQKKLVGLAAMVMVDGEVVESAVDGERKKGSGVPLEIGDRWHLGSITKSITATMIARLVESGQMQFTDTIGECFPDAAIHDDWKPVTLRQLLTHTAGAPANFSIGVLFNKPPLGAECAKARREAVLSVLNQKPDNPPGETFAYSNVGFTIAGAMAEKATGEIWEDLVQREVFEPLQLNGSGFGPPQSPDETLPQPRGHVTRLGWKIAPTDGMDNTYIMGPAAIVHTTLNDLCSYATEHLRGDSGAGKLLSAQTYELLHTPESDDYACGWVVKSPNDEIPHTVYWHNGSNTMWYALVVFIPEMKLVVAVASNDGDLESAEAAAWEIVKATAKKNAVAVDSPNSASVEGVGQSNKSSVGQDLSNLTFDEAAKRGMDAFKRRDFDKAIVAWNEAIRLDPNHSEVRRWRGDAWLNKRDPDKALSEYDEAIRLDPKNGMAFCSRGAAWTEKRKRDKAIADFDEAIKLAPEVAKLPFYQIFRKAAEKLRN